MARKITREFPPHYKPRRLDVALFDLGAFPSRAQARRAIDEGTAKLNGNPAKPGVKVKAGDRVEAFIADPSPSGLVPENLPLDIVYEDGDMVAVNKSPGMVVHPAAGHKTGTMAHAILYHCRDLSGVGGVMRPGVVHRLDKDTSGIILFAKNDETHIGLANQFRGRSVEKQYLAVIIGRMSGGEGVIESAIDRHPRYRTRMRGGAHGGRRASTKWKELEAFPGASLLEVRPATGRTHQIRVHLSEAGHPIVGDKVYGSKKRIKGAQNIMARTALMKVSRQMLHASRITIDHPGSGQTMTFSAPMPTDMANLVEALRDAS